MRPHGLRTSDCVYAELSASRLRIISGARDNVARIEDIAKICARYRFSYSLHAPLALNLMDEADRPLHMAVLQSCLRFASRIGAKVVVVHPGRVHPRADQSYRTRMLTVERDQMRRAADMAGANGQKIAMEL
ncbi:MAG: sugar phosphate isomerase/epimerase, partial [Verrucomicrobiaceae bacterium]